MLPLLVTLLFALFVLGPDLIFRWVVGFYAPSRARKRSYGEQIAIACVIAIIPDIFAWECTRHLFHVYTCENKQLLKDFFDGLMAPNAFDKFGAAFDHSLSYVFRLIAFCLGFVYLQVVGMAVLLGDRVLRNLGTRTRKYEILKSDTPEEKSWKERRLEQLDTVSNPFIAEWHMRLSRMLLPSKEAYIQADIMTSLDVLYRGKIKRHHLDADGALVSVTLVDTKKFKRQELLEDRKQLEETPDPDDYWSTVRGDFFILKADQIVWINLRHIVRPTQIVLSREELQQFVRDIIQIRAGAAAEDVDY